MTLENGERALVAVRFKIREVAHKQGFSMYRLQKESNIDWRTLRRLYRTPDQIVVSSETLDRIATVLGVDISELLESIPPDSPSAPRE